jgi:hypothetical protein
MSPGLFYEKPNHELNTKVKKNSPRFPTVIYMPSNGRRFRRYDFWTMTKLLKTVFWTDCSVEGNLNYGAVWMGFFPCAEYQNIGKLSKLSIGYLFSLIGLTV